MNEYRVNLNIETKVFLTEKGKRLLYEEQKQQLTDLMNHFKEPVPYMGEMVSAIIERVRPDEDGSFTAPLWEIMRIFGKCLSAGCEEPFVLSEMILHINRANFIFIGGGGGIKQVGPMMGGNGETFFAKNLSDLTAEDFHVPTEERHEYVMVGGGKEREEEKDG